jgi:hypothetical protein
VGKALNSEEREGDLRTKARRIVGTKFSALKVSMKCPLVRVDAKWIVGKEVEPV